MNKSQLKQQTIHFDFPRFLDIVVNQHRIQNREIYMFTENKRQNFKMIMEYETITMTIKNHIELFG